MAATAMSVHQFISNLNTSRPCGGLPWSKKVNRQVVRCCETATEVTEKRKTVVKNGNDSLEICRVLNGMWQTSGGWGRIDRDDAVEAMLRYADAGLSTFDMADHYGPAEDLYGIFINRVRRERPPEYLENVRGNWHAGKIKTVALTNFDTERLQKILENGIPIVSNQVQHSIVDIVLNRGWQSFVSSRASNL
ncbi:hypothetical protein DH2020_000386 [Rehmannia glutinosa]|uniref:NADP-dependent oxidoreductase domain-containing protein n=1 Tax=Rehmannia glutinosa TaxID=99300 RepID=A0ABR0XWB6_REHGL